MRDSWQQRIERASELAAGSGATRSLLDTLRRLLELQRDSVVTLERNAHQLSGSLERDWQSVAAFVPRLLEEFAAFGPARLVGEARDLIDAGPSATRSLLLTAWRSPSDEGFFARLLLQPYASVLAAHGLRPLDRDLPEAGKACPFCGGRPQVSILQHAPDGEGGGRSLQCATCFTLWPFRRLLCASCGEEDERQLGYFHAPEYDHLRVDTCDTCQHYVKSVDLTRLGLAVPIVDEVAGAALDVWAHARGYEKIQLNLIGL
jgi:FdhE protein